MNYNTVEETKTVIHLIYVTSSFIITGKSEQRAIKSKMCWWFLHKRLKAPPKPEVHFTIGFRALKCKGCWRHEGLCGRRGVTARIINLGYQKKKTSGESPRYPLEGCPRGPRGRSGCYWEKKTHLRLLGLELGFDCLQVKPGSSSDSIQRCRTGCNWVEERFKKLGAIWKGGV